MRDNLVLVKVKPGETIRYFAGGAWKPAGKITSPETWNGISPRKRRSSRHRFE